MTINQFIGIATVIFFFAGALIVSWYCRAIQKEIKELKELDERIYARNQQQIKELQKRVSILEQKHDATTAAGI